jgi:hypothetical protein
LIREKEKANRGKNFCWVRVWGAAVLRPYEEKKKRRRRDRAMASG